MHESMIRQELIGLNLEQMEKFCSQFDCTVTQESVGWYLVQTKDATNLFWLGANFGAANPFPTSSLTTNHFLTAKSGQ